jgi:hypothetical protein
VRASDWFGFIGLDLRSSARGRHRGGLRNAIRSSSPRLGGRARRGPPTGAASMRTRAPTISVPSGPAIIGCSRARRSRGGQRRARRFVHDILHGAKVGAPPGPDNRRSAGAHQRADHLRGLERPQRREAHLDVARNDRGAAAASGCSRRTRTVQPSRGATSTPSAPSGPAAMGVTPASGAPRQHRRPAALARSDQPDATKPRSSA